MASESAGLAYAEQETDELLAVLRETESLDEQGDILQYLVDTHGLDFNTGGWVAVAAAATVGPDVTLVCPQACWSTGAR